MIDQEVDLSLADQSAFIVNIDGCLADEWYATESELDRHGLFIDPFEKFRTKLPVDLDGGADDLVGQCICTAIRLKHLFSCCSFAFFAFFAANKPMRQNGINRKGRRRRGE